MILTIEFSDGTTQVLRDFHHTFNPNDANIKAICHDIAQGLSYTYKVEHIKFK